MTSLADKAILSGADNPTEAIQADCDVKATNIILQGLPPKVYALVSTYKVTKELWERIQMLMQGTSLMKQERECKLYDEFDKFSYRKGESLRDFYLRFSLLLNDMNIYNIKLEQFQVNTKFLNTLPLEWSKFVTDVKLYASQDPSSTPLLITYPVNDFQSSVNQNVYNPSSSIPQVEYALAVHNNLSSLNLILGSLFKCSKKGRQNSMIAGMSRQYTSRPSGTSGKQRVIVCYNCKGEGYMSKQCTKPMRKRDEAWFKDKVKILKEQNNVDKASESCAQSLEIDNLRNVLSEHLKEKESLEQNVTLLKNNFQKEESRNIDRELALEKQTLLPQIHAEIREEFRTSSGPSNTGGHPPPERLKREYHSIRQTNTETSTKFMQKSGDRHQPTSQQSSHRNHDHNNDGHGSNRQSGGDNHRINNYSGSNN
nr:hypothetical protein [Tanacetum cinerariifolium]